MNNRCVLAWLAALAACGDHAAPDGTPRSPLETTIARELTQRLGVPVTTRCRFIVTWPAHCHATLPDGTTLPIRVRSVKHDWDWEVEGRVVITAPIAAYVTAVLGDLKVPQTVACAAPIVRLDATEPLVCALSGGGTAFIDVRADGAMSLELAIDPAVARVRMEIPHERELLKTSRLLEHGSGGEEGEDEHLPADGGVDAP